VPFIGTVTRKIHLRHGDYRFQCDPHSFAMFGTFTVSGRGQD
jgi:plastocyanin